jgi:hypothetical protein
MCEFCSDHDVTTGERILSEALQAARVLGKDVFRWRERLPAVDTALVSRIVGSRTGRTLRRLNADPSIPLAVAKVNLLHLFHKHFVGQVTLLAQQLPHRLASESQGFNELLEFSDLGSRSICGTRSFSRGLPCLSYLSLLDEIPKHDVQLLSVVVRRISGTNTSAELFQRFCLAERPGEIQILGQ